MSKRNTSKTSPPKKAKTETDWARLDAMTDGTPDLSDHPEMTPEMFAAAIARKGLKPVARKQQVTLRIDSDVLDWFRGQGKGYQSRINRLLRAYMEANRSSDT